MAVSERLCWRPIQARTAFEALGQALITSRTRVGVRTAALADPKADKIYRRQAHGGVPGTLFRPGTRGHISRGDGGKILYRPFRCPPSPRDGQIDDLEVGIVDELPLHRLIVDDGVEPEQEHPLGQAG
jgi:hypothetical protein